MRIVGERKPELTEELAHFGVKGMKWGNRKTEASGSISDRQKLKRMDREARDRDKKARDSEIDAARQRYNTSARSNYLKAKAQYKIDKNTIGKHEARKKFDAVKTQNEADFAMANQAKSGKETTAAILSTVGSVLVIGLLSTAAHR